MLPGPLFAAVLLPLFAAVLCQVQVQTQYGPVEGHVVPVNNGRDTRDIVSFLAVPFAQDTSGDNRFRRPVAPAPWTEPYVADTVGPACPQGPGGLLLITHRNWTDFSEDCLNVNIYTPDVSASNAVMVYFFGGGYQGGANFQYPGHFLATRDVVVVAVNYRLGVLGFSYTGDDAAPGNVGLWDQNMAVQFVRDNIANFGGDPQRITLFGESAGSGSTALHMLSPQSKDLFQQAILQSGAETNFWVINPPESYPANYTLQTAASLGCTGDTFTVMECMRGLEWENIVENGTWDCAEGFICMGISPVVDDPVTGFLPDTPQKLREAGDIMTGSIITGINHDDASVFLPVFVPESLFGCCNRSYFELLLDRRIVDILAPFVDEATHDQLVEALNFYYSPWPYVVTNYNNREALIQMVTDAVFGAQYDAQLKAQAQLSPSYGYIYNYRSRNFTEVFPEWFGIPHIAEVPYAWGHTLLPFNEAVRADSLVNVDLVDWTEEDVQHTIFWQDMLTNFAKFGDPTPEPVDNPIGGSTVWPRFTSGNMKSLVVSNTTIEAREFRQRNYEFWASYFPYLASLSTRAQSPYRGDFTGLAPDAILSFVSDVIDAATSGEFDGYPLFGDEYDEEDFMI